MKFLLPFLITFPLFAAKPPSGGGGTTPWTFYKWASNGQYIASGNGTNWAFPSSGHNVAYATFVITNNSGDLSGKTISCTYTVTTIGSPQFIWGGYLSGWNTTGFPANARLFISSMPPPYSNSGYTACPTCYWWSSQWAEINNGTDTISDSVTNLAHWSDAQGHNAADPNYTASFLAAVSLTKQCGIALSGGSFYDCGVAILNGTGTGTFTLNSFNSQ